MSSFPMVPNVADIPYSGFLRFERWHVPGSDRLVEIVRASDSAAGVLHDVTNRRVLFIKQNHVAAISRENPNGTLVTPFAGRFDRKVSPKQLLVAEAQEEVGADITEDDVELLNHGVPMTMSPGVLTERTYLSYAQIAPERLSGTDSDVRSAEGENEQITRYWVPIEELKNMVFDDLRVFAFAMFILLRQVEYQFTLLQDEMNALRDQASLIPTEFRV